ncbi:MAG: hypothetical protein CMI90_01575 [Pelagibacteraceae bacterium]|nr:hypothetical protein [Pelagibacteraceae bacterium]
MRIYLEIETKRRELDARILFSVLAASKGFSIVIGRKNKLLSRINFFSPGIYIMKGSRYRPAKLAKNFRKNNFFIFCYDEEGLINISDEYTFHRIPQETLEAVDKFLTWGESETSLLKKNYPEYSEKILTSGNARLDLLKSPIKQIYFDEAKKINEKYGKFDLYVSGFNRANAITKPGLNWLEGSKFDSENIKKTFTRFFHLQKNNMEKTIEFLNLNSDKIKKKIIIRPHPAENISTWKNELKDNLKDNVIYDHLNTNAWMLAADNVFSFYSGALIEAYLLGKSPANLIFEEGNPFKDDFIYNFCKDIVKPKDYDDLILQSNKIREQSKNKDDLSFHIKNTKFFTADIICDEALKFLNNSNYKKIHDKFSNRFFFNFFVYLDRIKNFKYNYLSKKSDQDRQSRMMFQKNPGITIQEVNFTLKSISELLGIKNLVCKEIYPGAFEIKKNF